MSLAEILAETIGRTGIEAGRATVAELSGALAAGLLTAEELVAFYTERIERLNAGYGAVISVSPDAAEQARAADRARASQAATGPLAGIPVLVKDNIAVDGQPATAGSPALLHAAGTDAFAIGRLRSAGAIVLGKANLSEWANFRSTSSTSGWSTLGGQAVNPHGPGRNPSGSSSGSAVAVAAGLAPLAIGTETDGSILSPSSVCGLVGVKPTLGLVSRSGIVPVSLEQDTAGPMTRCVADAAVLLAALTGHDPADEATADAPRQGVDYAAHLDVTALAGARIGIWREGSAEATTATAALLDAAVDLLRSAGAEVIDPVELADAGNLAEPEFIALRHEFKDDMNSYLASIPGEHPMSLSELITFNRGNNSTVMAHFGQEIFELADQTGGRAAPECRQARADARRIARTAIDQALAANRLAAVVSLTGSPAWLTDYVAGDHYRFGTSAPAAVAGYPSVTVPAGRVCGLPVGLSFAGPAWSEAELLGLAYSFEHAGADRPARGRQATGGSAAGQQR